MVYRCINANFFKLWKRFYVGVPLLWIVFAAYYESAGRGFEIALIVNILILLVTLPFYYTQIAKEANTYIFNNLRKRSSLKNINEIESWWCYSFGRSTREINADGATKKTRGHINTVYLYATLKSDYNSITIYEEIYMSSKFPNGHPYKATVDTSDLNLFKVWDVDQCLMKLRLDYNNTD